MHIMNGHSCAVLPLMLFLGLVSHCQEIFFCFFFAPFFCEAFSHYLKLLVQIWDVSAFVPEMCRHMICWCVGLRARNVVVGLRADVFLAGFGNLPVQGRCCQNFQLFFKLLTFLSCHSRSISSLLCSINRGRRRTISEGRRHRKLGRRNPHIRREPLPESVLCRHAFMYWTCELWTCGL